MIFKLCARSHPPLLDGFWSPLAVLDDHPKAVLHDHPNVAEALDANLNVEEVLDVHPKFGPTGSRNECGKTWLMREKREKQTNVDAI